MLRLVDVAPGCRSPDDLAAHLAGLPRRGRAPSVRARPRDADGRQRGRAAPRSGRRWRPACATSLTASSSPRRPPAPGRLLRELWELGAGASVDLLGEATVTAAEADRYAARCSGALSELARGRTASAPPRPRPRSRLARPGPAREPVGEGLRADPAAAARGARARRADAAPRLRPLLRRARELGAHVHIDMESFDSREAVVALVLDLLAEEEFREGPSAGVVVQAYLTDSPALTERIVAWGERSGRAQPLVVRLVKGAYWDHEVVDAAQHGWKAARVRAQGRQRPQLRVADATPDRGPPATCARRSPHTTCARSPTRSSPPRRPAPAQARSSSRFSTASATSCCGARRLGYRVRAYCPVGDLVAGMAYLVRRLLENTANDGFLRRQADGRPPEELLAAP